MKQVWAGRVKGGMRSQRVGERLPLSANDFHILLVLSEGELYGYALLKAIEAESGGAVRPDLGTLYRALARLSSEGLLTQTVPHVAPAPSPGRERRYYDTTALGRAVLLAEVDRLRGALEIASGRLAQERGKT